MPIFRAAVGSMTGNPRSSLSRIRSLSFPASAYIAPMQERPCDMQFLFHGLVVSGLAYLESGEVLARLVPCHAKIANKRPRWSILAPADHVRNICLWALEDCLDPTRVEIAHPATEPPPAGFLGDRAT